MDKGEVTLIYVLGRKCFFHGENYLTLDYFGMARKEFGKGQYPIGCSVDIRTGEIVDSLKILEELKAGKRFNPETGTLTYPVVSRGKLVLDSINSFFGKFSNLSGKSKSVEDLVN